MPGNLTVPNVIGNQPGGNILASLFDDNWNAQNAYINARQPSSGLIAARPAASTGNAGLIYLATDVAGGTAYLSTGTVWIAMGAGVVPPPVAVPGAIAQAHTLQGSRAGPPYSTTSATFVDVDATNLKVTLTVPTGSAFLIAWATFSVLGTLITDGQPHVRILAAGSAIGPWNWSNNSVGSPAGPFTVFGFVATPPAGSQTVALQFSGDGVNTFNLANQAEEGSNAVPVFSVVPKMLVLVTT